MTYYHDNIFHILRNKAKCKIFRMGFFLLLLFIITGFSTKHIQAASGIKIYNYQTKKTSTYADKQVKITLNGKNIGSSDTPGILVNGIALLPFYDTFVSSEIGAEYSYNKTKGTVTISKYGTTITMKIGSTAATVNGKAVTLPVAPMHIKYVAANKAKILVPSRYISETLGLGYTWYSNKNTVAIETKALKLSYNSGKAFEYTGTQGKVTIDGKAIDLEGMPSIITNNTAMLQAKKVFGQAPISANYSYDASKKKVTISKNGKTLIMTIGSNKALLNNKEVTMDTAPMLVKNHNNNVTYVMVPGSFTATSLGYGYKWNKTTSTSEITSPKNTNDSSDSSQEAPELGDNGVVNDKGTVLMEWTGNEELYGKSSNSYELNNEINSTSDVGTIYMVARDNTKNTYFNSETFMITATEPFSRVTTLQSGNKLSIIADKQICSEVTYQVYGSSSNLVNTITLINQGENKSSQIDMELLPTDYQYEVTYSSDYLTLYVTIYQNVITSATIGVNSAGDYLTLTGINPLTVDITEEEGYLYLDLPYIATSIGDISSEITGTTYLNQIFSVTDATKTRFILILQEGCTYYSMESGNQYTLSIQQLTDSEELDDIDQSGSADDVTNSSNIPMVTDKSKYEIAIPLPIGVSIETITHEDFYYNKYFVIRIPGNYKEFYDLNAITNNSNVVNKITVSVTNNDLTEIKVATSKLQGYELAFDSEYLYVNVGNPKEIYKNIVVLDPGHGGEAKGAQYYGTKEKDVNFEILYTIGKKYFNSDPSKLKVYYTRTSDVDISLANRAAYVKTVGADLFVSLHMNAASPSVSGTEVFYSSNNNAANRAGLTSQELASYFVSNLTTTLGTKSRGVKHAAYTVIHKNTVPAVLIELGFLSNEAEHAKLTDSSFQEKAAKVIYDTLLQVFEDYPTGR